MAPHPVTQLEVCLKNVLFEEARQTGLINSVKFTGEASCRRVMSLFVVVLLQLGCFMILETVLVTSFAFSPCCVCRPRYTVRPAVVVLENGRRRSAKHSPHQLNHIFLFFINYKGWFIIITHQSSALQSEPIDC